MYSKKLYNVIYGFEVLKVFDRLSCPNTFNQERETYGFQEFI
jgi:hypothetical protein